jgi:NTE family protein
MALCLSGGGYRAMLFHVGSVWRLHRAGLLARLDRVSSVSGGSITAGMLGLAWHLIPDDAGFQATVVAPIRDLASRTIDIDSVIAGALLPGGISDRIVKAYRRLFGNKTLQDLPDHPRFVINATNVQSGVLWRFSKPYMADYRVGEVPNPTIEVAVAVGASSAFPPFLSPAHIELPSGLVQPMPGADLHQTPYTTDLLLTDAGVYDNLGLETAWKKYLTVLVSDAGGHLGAEPEPHMDWPRHVLRVLDIIDNQVRSLRVRQVIGAFRQPDVPGRSGAYWGIRTNITDYPLADPLPCPHDVTVQLAAVPTRLARMDDRLQERLINWGWAVTDAGIRAHLDTNIPRADFPYPHGVQP